MPCTYTGSLDEDTIYFLREDLDDLTDMLCRLCHIAENVVTMPRDIKIWYEDHKKKDAKRDEDEKSKEKGIR